jgi:hypothetical protein
LGGFFATSRYVSYQLPCVGQCSRCHGVVIGTEQADLYWLCDSQWVSVPKRWCSDALSRGTTPPAHLPDDLGRVRQGLRMPCGCVWYEPDAGQDRHTPGPREALIGAEDGTRTLTCRCYGFTCKSCGILAASRPPESGPTVAPRSWRRTSEH